MKNYKIPLQQCYKKFTVLFYILHCTCYYRQKRQGAGHRLPGAIRQPYYPILIKITGHLHLNSFLQNQSEYFKISMMEEDKLQGRKVKTLRVTKNFCLDQGARALKELVFMIKFLTKTFIKSKNKENKDFSTMTDN